MSDNENKKNDAEQLIDDVVESVKNLADAAETEMEEVIDSAKDLAKDVAGAIKDVVEEAEEDFKEKYLKVLAEMENLRKRFDQDKMDVLRYKATSFIMNILPTIDMFEMAMKPKDLSEDVKAYVVGFEMIFNNFKSALEGEGVKEIIVKPGDEFDSKIHHAIEEVESEEIEPGKVVEVKQKGYTLHDRLLRPATVTVSKVKGE